MTTTREETKGQYRRMLATDDGLYHLEMTYAEIKKSFALDMKDQYEGLNPVITKAEGFLGWGEVWRVEYDEEMSEDGRAVQLYSVGVWEEE